MRWIFYFFIQAGNLLGIVNFPTVKDSVSKCKPPMMPKILNAACNTPPNCSATKTNPKETSPKKTAKNLEIFVAFSSLRLGKHEPLMKSSKVMAAKLLRPLETVLCKQKYA